MSNQPEHENQQSQTVAPEEVRQSLLTELEVRKQTIAVLSDEQLAAVRGGVKGMGALELGHQIFSRVVEGRVLKRTQSAPGKLESAPFNNAVSPGSTNSAHSTSSLFERAQLGLGNMRVHLDVE